MKRLIFKCAFMLVIVIPATVYSQDTLSLQFLLKGMQQNNSLYRVSSATDSVYALRKSNIKVNYLPRVDFNAEATWQSDVTSVNIPIPTISMPSPDKDNYKLTVDVSQLIWDGGVTSSRLKSEENARMLEQNKVDNELYTLKDRVSTLYFGVSSIDIAIQQLRIMEGELDKRIAEIQSGVNAGAILESSLISLQAEKLRLGQSIDANLAQRTNLLESIYAITGVNIGEQTELKLPNLVVPTNNQCNRPDYKTFDLQKGYLASTSKILSSKRMPTLAAFAKAGYGKPGLNMLSSEFDTYAILGARLSWNIWDWNSTSRERQNIKIQQNIMEYRRDVFDDNYNSQVKSSIAQINSLEKQILSDEKIVQLLEKSVQVSASQLKNGTITSATYLSDFNSLLRARIDMSLRKVKLSHEKVKLYFTMGLDINE
ncbi:transporter [Tenuifilaceae bacterium CYCD]|nr:transporter [Tenuifilaceae bacterium CYCD]